LQPRAHSGTRRAAAVTKRQAVTATARLPQSCREAAASLPPLLTSGRAARPARLPSLPPTACRATRAPRAGGARPCGRGWSGRTARSRSPLGHASSHQSPRRVAPWQTSYRPEALAWLAKNPPTFGQHFASIRWDSTTVLTATSGPPGGAVRCGRRRCAITTIVASGSRPAPETPLNQRAVERTHTVQ
jgi:hypothetical protein